MRGAASTNLMDPARLPARSTATAVMICNGLLGFQYIGSVVTRDALFLSSLDAATRPLMIGASGGLWVLLAAINFHFRRRPLALVVPVTFGASGVLMLIDFALVASQPTIVAQAFFLQTNALGPILGSLLSLVIGSQTDPRAARSGFGRIMGAWSLGGLIGAFAAGQIPSWFGIGAMFPVLAALNLTAGGLLWRLARPAHGDAALSDKTVADTVHQIFRLDYVPILAAVLLLGSASAAFMEHLVSVQAQTSLQAAALPSFFSAYHITVTLAVITVQTTLARQALKGLRVGGLMSISSLVLVVGSLGAWAVPGLVAVTAAHGLGSVVHDSLFKRAYEQFFTSVPSGEQRTFKPIADSLFNRLGTAAAAGLIALLTLLAPARLHPGLLLATLLCAGGAVLLAKRMTRLYVSSLERSLLGRVTLTREPSDVKDPTTRTVMLRTDVAPPDATVLVAETQQILALRSRDGERIVAVLDTEPAVPAAVVSHVIPLLAWDPVCERAVRALRRVAEEHVGELVDALINPNQPFAVRRRVARVFSVCVSQRAVDGLLYGLEDLRFDVRFQCGRSLAAILEKNGMVRIDRDRILDSVHRETLVSRPIWESQRLPDEVEEDERTSVDEFLETRTDQSLAHVFTLLSLVLPPVPLRISFQLLHGDDRAFRGFRGTALEYLEEVLPADIRDRLFLFLEVTEEPRRRRPRDEIVADLLRAGLDLEALRRRARGEESGR
jgi:hypothetical protein